jgi:catechol 2,3-dioxygenase-like lactoylglutathione lyase family enzyme
MAQQTTQVAITVCDYDEAIAFFVQKLGFELVEDTPLGGGKRWVRVHPPGGSGPTLLLARAVGEQRLTSVGNQTGGRVFVFLETDDLRRDYRLLSERGVTFVRGPSEEPFGTVAVFSDLYGNLSTSSRRGSQRAPANQAAGGCPAGRCQTTRNPAGTCPAGRCQTTRNRSSQSGSIPALAARREGAEWAGL